MNTMNTVSTINIKGFSLKEVPESTVISEGSEYCIRLICTMPEETCVIARLEKKGSVVGICLKIDQIPNGGVIYVLDGWYLKSTHHTIKIVLDKIDVYNYHLVAVGLIEALPFLKELQSKSIIQAELIKELYLDLEYYKSTLSHIKSFPLLSQDDQA